MLTTEQVTYFKTFGFVILRKLFTSDELDTIHSEFDHRAAVATSYNPFDGTKRHTMIMMGEDTPFFASFLDEPRFASAAEQLYGEVLAWTSTASRLVGKTYWHYDAGGYEGYGILFIFYPYEPLRAGTGALRVIPGSHLRPWHDTLDENRPLCYAWARKHEEEAAADEVIESIPGYVCETEPCDVIAMDTRLWHASLGGLSDRRMCNVVFHSYPSSPQEMAMAIFESKGYLTKRDNSTEPWNPTMYAPQEWIDNHHHHPKRQLWIDRLRELEGMDGRQTGYQIKQVDGKCVTVPI